MYSNCGTVEIRTGEVSVEAGREKEGGGGTVYCRGEGGWGGGGGGGGWGGTQLLLVTELPAHPMLWHSWL